MMRMRKRKRSKMRVKLRKKRMMKRRRTRRRSRKFQLNYNRLIRIIPFGCVRQKISPKKSMLTFINKLQTIGRSISMLNNFLLRVDLNLRQYYLSQREPHSIYLRPKRRRTILNYMFVEYSLWMIVMS